MIVGCAQHTCSTIMSSAFAMVLRRWAIAIVVRWWHTRCSDVWMARSVCVSSADVASSKRTICGACKEVNSGQVAGE